MTPDEVRSIRLGAGLTQEALARRLNVTLSAVKGWESGRRRPSGAVTILLSMIRDGEMPEVHHDR